MGDINNSSHKYNADTVLNTHTNINETEVLTIPLLEYLPRTKPVTDYARRTNKINNNFAW